jgi:integral membrane protein (TIGR01906 family)
MGRGVAAGGVSGRPALRARGGLRRLAVGVASGLCIVAIPFVLVGYNLRGVALDQRFYLTEFTRYRIAAQTGFASDELRIVADAFVDYFLAPRGRMSLQLARGGALQPLFNERELAHMEDVQALIQAIFRVQEFALGYFLLYLLAGLALRRRAFLALAARVLALGGGLTMVLFVALGGLALVDFSELFLQFHLVSFANDLWLLDPERDYLIRLFPQGFFQDAALRIAAFTMLQALGLLLVGLIGIWWTRRHPARTRA